MDFSAYTTFQAEFENRYGALAEEFPLSMMVLEQDLRNFRFGDTAIAKRNYSRQTDRLYFVEMLIKHVSNRRERAPQAYIEMPGFRSLSADMSARLQANGIQNFSEQKFFGFSANKALHVMVRLGRVYADAFTIAGRDGPDALLEDREIMGRLEAQLTLNYERMKRFVIAQNIQLFLAAGDAKPFSRFLCKIAREIGRPYIVLAHGYVSHSTLISIAPLHADRLIVWTQQQRSLLCDALPDECNKIQCHGFPVRTDVPDRSAVERRVLFAWEPLLRLNKREPHLAALRKLAQTCLAADYKPIIRLHPKERQFVDLAQELQDMGFEVDHGNMAEALAKAAMVVSSNSTVLCEAAAAGIPAVQIADLAVFKNEGARMVAIADFDPEAEARTTPDENALPMMDNDQFFADLMDTMDTFEKAIAAA